MLNPFEPVELDEKEYKYYKIFMILAFSMAIISTIISISFYATKMAELNKRHQWFKECVAKHHPVDCLNKYYKDGE